MPKCEGAEHYYLKTQKRWKCKKCAKQFSVKLGTIFEDSPISLDKWLVALWMLVNCKNGISSYEVGRDLGITQKVCLVCAPAVALGFAGKVSRQTRWRGQTVEVDETFIGGLSRNMHKQVRARKIHGTGGRDKTLVVGFLERGGKVRTSVPSNRRKHTMHKEVKQNVSAGSILFTDELKSYNDLAEEFRSQSN